VNYRRIYSQIVERAKTRPRPDCYCERHHVVPKSMGGTDATENIVVLTAREHYLAHWLLFKIHRTREMAFAWHRMTCGKKSVQRYSSKTFAYAAIARANAMRDMFSGKTLTPEHKEKLRAAKLGKTYAEMGRAASSLAGRTLSDEHKAKVAASSKGRRLPDAARRKLSEGMAGDRNHRYGKPVPEETRRKLSEAQTAYRAKVRELKKEQSK